MRAFSRTSAESCFSFFAVGFEGAGLVLKPSPDTRLFFAARFWLVPLPCFAFMQMQGAVRGRTNGRAGDGANAHARFDGTNWKFIGGCGLSADVRKNRIVVGGMARRG